jgi:hypothetical protein
MYWKLTLVTTNNYDGVTGLHTPKITNNYSTHKFFSVFISRFLVEDSNGERSTSSGFWNGPRLQLPASHFTKLQILIDSTTAQSQTYFTTGGLPPISSILKTHDQRFFISTEVSL